MFFVENSGKNQEGSDVAPSMYQSISLTLRVGNQGFALLSSVKPRISFGN
jgi:hypothetical protein